MYPIDSTESLRGGQFHFKNDTGNSKIHSSSALSYHKTTPYTTSFNNEQSYARVVGQVTSGETVTKIYKDPQTFWNQEPIGYSCYFCRSALNPQDINSWVPCASPNCIVYSHTGCLMKSGFQDPNRPWYCSKCMPPRENYSSHTPLNNNIETNHTPPVNPLHLLLEASDQIQSNCRPQMNMTTCLAGSSAPHIENNCISTQPKLITSGEFTSITAINDNEKEEIEALPSKFECQYALCEEERNNTIRNLERTRTRQNQVTNALKESVTRLTREHNKQLERYESLEKDNEKLNCALHKLKLALIPLAQERPVLQILRKMTRNEDLQVRDIHQDNVLQLFLRLLPSSTISSIFGTTPITSPSISSPNINIPSLPTIHSSLYEKCQKCSKIGGHLVSCINCHVIQHVACCSKGEKPSIETMDIQWLCINCKNFNSKRKNCSDKNADTKVAAYNLLSGHKRIKVCNLVKENENKSKNGSPLHSISTQNLNNGGDEGVLSPQLTPHKVEINKVSITSQKQNSTDLALPNTPMSGDNESNESDDSSFTSKSSGMEIDVSSNQDELRFGSLDRAPPPDNGPEVTKQPPRFDGDMYTPRWVRGVGKSKEGLCPHCEPARWLKTKISAYWYHLNYQHGVSSITGRPFAQPTAERMFWSQKFIGINMHKSATTQVLKKS
ncbi:unnamed protein product [Rhizophagus irregularis]|uniref:Zinc finger PHD-type domain-containing protein n=1 Tax=Rhizophagus irregularis TaxID=588596 RepID=A0A915Z9R1_9GLOM|nr:conserved fungal protein [Rhizophagus irregularis DAOM 181602=DAOM 197198]CAB4461687.1 unnamed protein product [Rhizophagus irregularis]CAB5142194.1 unnamed protein product [Rhizophagus irregularis]CAB5366383.1 unnamed protein product [Rhizophagus irregularis]